MKEGFRAWTLQDWHRYSPGAPTWKAVLGALIFNAGFLAVFLFRASQAFAKGGHPTLSRLCHRLNLGLSAAELNPAATVGPGLYLPHPYGVGIGGGCCLGSEVTLHQGVSLGAKTVSVAEHGREVMYPEVGSGALFYPHVLAYGPVKIGADATILGNAVVAGDVPPGAVYGGIPARAIKIRADVTAKNLRGSVVTSDTPNE